MKKIFVSLFVIAASLNAMATDFAVATLTLKGNTSLEQGEVTLVKTDDPAAASYCAPVNDYDLYNVIMFAINGSDKYQIWANANLENLELGIKTYSDANYTITVSNVSGSETLNLFDAVANQTIALTEGKTYEFTADPNQTITNRFSIVAAAPVAKSFCFRNNILEINGYKGDANVKIDDAAVAITSDNFTRPFTAAEAGRHKLTIDGKDYLFDAFPSNVTPVVP